MCRPIKRVRCSECRCWFHPKASARRHQKTCSEKCRRERRGKLARQRRQADPEHFRELEAGRQRRRRARLRAEAGAGPPVSRAGLDPQAAEILDDFIEKLGQREQLSRAGLRRGLRRVGLEMQRIAAEGRPRVGT